MSRRGQMLLVVLWVMGLLSLAVGTLAVRSNHELRLGAIPLTLVQRRALAEGAVEQAAALLRQDDPSVDHLEELWATGVTPDTKTQVLLDVPLGGGRYSIGSETDGGLQPGLLDEERKLNLNSPAAGVDALTKLLAAAGPPGTDAGSVAKAIVAWRTTCQDIPQPCHGGLFDSTEELQLVPGMTEELFSGVSPYVTVYGNGSVNVNTAPAEVLTALGCNAEAILQQRAHAPLTTPPADCPGSGVVSEAFTVPVEVWIAGRADPGRAQAVISRTGCAAQPPAGRPCVLSWNAPR